MKTYYAAPERTPPDALAAEIETVSGHPLLSGLLNSVSGLLAVLDEHRQLVALNDRFLEALGIEDPSETLGLRLGEAVQCIHAREEPAGCGTSRFCSTCGAAIAFVSSLELDVPAEKICALTARRGGKPVEISLLVRSNPIRIEGKRFLLIFLQDITLQQQRAALERTFFHDISNLMIGINGASEALALEGGASELVNIIVNSSSRLMQEIQIQKSLMQSGDAPYHPVRRLVSPAQVMEDLRAFYARHPAAQGKNLLLSASGPGQPFTTDGALLLRVLCNMVTNALEATDAGGAVKVWHEDDRKSVRFCVWNGQAIGDDVALRVFQRNFSTKADAGRGIGTYSMKLFGEGILGGNVSFTTAPAEGTVFRIALPV